MYFTFEQPMMLWFLFLIPLLLFAHFYFLKSSKAKAVRFANYETLMRIKGERVITKNLIHLSFRVIIVLLLVLALAGANFWYIGDDMETDMIIVLDASASMTTEDIRPNRFEAAKDYTSSFVSNLPGHASVGLVTFGGVTFVNQRLTDSVTEFNIALNSADIIPASGTDMSNAIVTATNLLIAGDPDKARSILIISDGLGTVGSFVMDPIYESVSYARDNQVVINTITVGTRTGPVGFLPEYYNIEAAFDQTLMLRIAEDTGGGHFYAGTRQDLLEGVNNFEFDTSRGYIRFNIGYVSLIVALIFLFVDWILINTVFRRLI